MAILHGSWILDTRETGLFIWGETWRKIGAIETIESGINLRHPLAMTESELKTFLTSLQQSGKLNWQLPETAETPQETGKKTRRSSKTETAQIPAQNSSIRKEIRAIALPTQNRGSLPLSLASRWFFSRPSSSFCFLASTASKYYRNRVFCGRRFAFLVAHC